MQELLQKKDEHARKSLDDMYLSNIELRQEKQEIRGKHKLILEALDKTQETRWRGPGHSCSKMHNVISLAIRQVGELEALKLESDMELMEDALRRNIP